MSFCFHPRDVPELLLTQSIIELIFFVAKFHFFFNPFNQATFVPCKVGSREVAGKFDCSINL